METGLNEAPKYWFNDPIEKQLYSICLEQKKFCRKINFEKSTNILIVTDRNFGWSKGMQELFINNNDKLNVELVFSNEKYEEIFLPDVLIISGYLKNKDNYEILDRVKIKNRNVVIIMYALLDELIMDICVEHKITNMYERQENSIYDFLSYINSLL